MVYIQDVQGDTRSLLGEVLKKGWYIYKRMLDIDWGKIQITQQLGVANFDVWLVDKGSNKCADNICMFGPYFGQPWCSNST